MKQTELLYSNEVLLENARVMKLDYSLMEKNSEEDQRTSFYGVKITKYLDDLIESDEIDSISSSKDSVVAIIKMLCQFEVTPLSMVEIVDDLVTQGI